MIGFIEQTVGVFGEAPGLRRDVPSYERGIWGSRAGPPMCINA
jgi:hypothetical protein